MKGRRSDSLRSREEADVSQQDEAGSTAADGAGEAPEPTGVPAADAARELLATVDDAPLDQHVEVYEDVHRRLQEGLADLDEG
jgi:hypothetical protein